MPAHSPTKNFGIPLSHLIMIASLTGACIGLYAQKRKIESQSRRIEIQDDELEKLRIENHVLQLQNSQFKIYDLGLVHLKAIPSTDELTWEWWVYAPKGYSHTVCIATKGVTCGGFPKECRRQLGNLVGEPYRCKISVRKGRNGNWKIVQREAHGACSDEITSNVQIRLHPKLARQKGKRETGVFDPMKKIELLRVLGTPDTPFWGFLVWIECQKI